MSMNTSSHNQAGFSLVELIISMVITLVILGAGVAAFSGALSSRSYQSARTDALVSAQAALNVMSREIGNSGYGLLNNGIVLADSDTSQIHIRSNFNNANDTTADQGEDITFFCNSCDVNGGSVVRYDAYNGGSTSGIINSVSQVNFSYWDYDPATHAVTGPLATPSLNTARVTITLTVIINVEGQPTGDAANVRMSSDVVLRNSPYVLNRY